MTFSFISNQVSSSTQMFNMNCNCTTDMDSMIRSSANIQALKQVLLIKQPSPESRSFTIMSSIKSEKRAGLQIPPWRVPQLILNTSENESAHLTLANDFSYQEAKMFMKIRGQPLSINFRNKALLFILSKAFSKSMEQRLTVELRLAK